MDGEIELQVQTFTLNHIGVLIMNDTDNPWRLTGFYGWPYEKMKHKSWQLLKHLHTRHSIRHDKTGGSGRVRVGLIGFTG